jgi:hypothetical protein
VALFYADTSALVKLVRHESESDALLSYVEGAGLLSCELVLTEVPRAIRRAADFDPALPLAQLLAVAGELLDAIGLIALDRELLLAAGALAEPALRALDAIHVAAARAAVGVNAFVTYDERQAAAARLTGLRTVAPGA